MHTDVARVTSLCYSAVRVLGTVGIDLVGAVVLLVVLALVASKIGTDLGTRTSAVANLDLGDLGSDLDDAANDLVSYAEGKRNVLSPSTSDGVDIRSADTTGIDGDIDIVVLELLKGKLIAVLVAVVYTIKCKTYLLALESAPVLDVSDSESVGSLGVRHCGRCEIGMGI
jgi:hypothetical protein